MIYPREKKNEDVGLAISVRESYPKKWLGDFAVLQLEKYKIQAHP